MSNDDLPRSHAEETDSTKLGESVGQADRSGDIFPPEQPLAVGDPGIRSDGSIAPDDVDIRDWREQPERLDTDTPQGADSATISSIRPQTPTGSTTRSR